MFAFIGSLVIVGLLLWAGYATLRGKRQAEDEFGPTRFERAAADAGRVGAVGATGSHDATGVGTPTFLDDVHHDLHDAGSSDGSVT